MADAGHPRRKKPSPGVSRGLTVPPEQQLVEPGVEAPSMLPTDARSLVEELRAHQIELEMQNEELSRAQLQIDEARAKYFDLYDHAPVGYVTVDAKGVVTEANRTALHLLDLGVGQLLGAPLSRLVAAEDQDAFYLRMRAATRLGQPQDVELRMRRGDGHFQASIQGRVHAPDDGSGEPTMRLTFTDIDALRSAQRDERRIAARFRAVVQSSHDVIYTMNPDGIITFASPSWERVLGYDEASVVGRPFEDFVHPDDIAPCRTALGLVACSSARHAEVDYRIRCRDGGWRWFESTLAAELDSAGVVVECVGNARDITDRKSDMERMQRMAMTDALTGIGNRRQFFSAAATEFERARRHGHDLSLVLADIDGLKQINDSLGHAVGDLVLQLVGKACADVGRDADEAGRLGGDEFGILLPHSDAAAAFDVGERLRLRVEQQSARGELPDGLAPTVSVGLGTAGPDDRDYLGMCKRADHALYRAKQAGRNQTCS
jgi:diguanylate cyclase (GGDEF)-like protein/PAS domain S-box-containing protein